MKEKILALRLQGLTYDQIKAELGCSKGTIAYYCGEGQHEKARLRNQVKRNKYRRYIEEYKEKNHTCLDCKNPFPHYVLQFDHRPDEIKLFTIGNTKTIPSLDALVAEVAKCDVVCGNCHSIRTWERLIGR